jgi:hypothetical protein
MPLEVTRKAGDSRYITLDWARDLATSETISTVTWTPESGVTEVPATSAISGSQTSARFSTPTAGKYRVDVQIATATPAETIGGEFFINVYSPPEGD